MRRLTLLLGALVPAFAGARLLLPLAAVTGSHLRDAGVVLALAALLFGLNSLPPMAPRSAIVYHRWPATGRVLALTGLLCALTGGLLFQFDGGGTMIGAARVGLWILGLILLPVGALWRGAPERYPLPGYRWQRTARGDFERVPAAGMRARSDSDAVRLPWQWLWLLLILLLGTVLRFWQLGSRPEGCIGVECAAALQLLEGMPGREELFDPAYALAGLFHRQLDDAVLSLRLAAALLGTGALLVSYPVLRRMATPAAALIGTLLLAFSPVHLTAGRVSEPMIAPVFFVLGALGFLWRGLQAGTRADWTAAGLLLGMAVLSAPALLPGILLWGMVLLVLAFVRRHLWLERNWWIPLLLFTGSIAAVLLPITGISPPGEMRAGRVAVEPALIGLALGACGLGTLLRSTRRVDVAAVLAGLVLVPASLFLAGDGDTVTLASPETITLLLTLLPFALVAATIAADQVVVALVDSWGILVRPHRLAALAALPVALLLVLNLSSVTSALENAGGAAGPLNRALLEAALATDGIDSEFVTFVPPAVLNHAQAQLRARTALDAGTLQPLTGIEALLQRDDRALRILVPATDQQLQEVIAAYFPASRTTPVFDQENGMLLYTETIVPPAHTGARLNPASIGESWQGSLLITQPGRYGFTVDGLAADDQFTLLLDNRLLLDTSLDRTTGSELLAQGIYQVDLRYAPADPANRVFLAWTRPDGVTEFPPEATLSSRQLPDLGLMATYFPNAEFTPPALALRKDLFLEDRPAVDFPYSVVWQGKLAANRAGEYLLALVADGSGRIRIDNAELLVLDPAAAGDRGTGDGLAGYAEGIVYLEPGWHDLEIRFVPRTPESTLDLLWQPPGGQPTGLSPLYLRPDSARLTANDLPLPPAPALTDIRLARGEFALTQGVELRRVFTGLLPDRLPTVPAARQWQTDTGCGPSMGQLNRPHGVVVDPASGRIYVADTGNARIAVFDQSGAPLIPLAPTAGGVPVLAEPVDVAQLSDGTLVVLDATLQQIVRIDPVTGEFVRLGNAGDFYRPRGLAVLADDVILVADTGGGRIALLAADGTRLFDYGDRNTALARGQPVDVAGTGRDLWAVTAEDGRLWEMNIPGSVTVIARAVSVDGPHLALRPDDSFYLSDPARRSILYHSADGRPIGRIAYPGAFDLPTGVAAADLEGDPHLAVVDTARCSLSLWQMP